MMSSQWICLSSGYIELVERRGIHSKQLIFEVYEVRSDYMRVYIGGWNDYSNGKGDGVTYGANWLMNVTNLIIHR